MGGRVSMPVPLPVRQMQSFAASLSLAPVVLCLPGEHLHTCSQFAAAFFCGVHGRLKRKERGTGPGYPSQALSWRLPLCCCTSSPLCREALLPDSTDPRFPPVLGSAQAL